MDATEEKTGLSKKDAKIKVATLIDKAERAALILEVGFMMTEDPEVSFKLSRVQLVLRMCNMINLLVEGVPGDLTEQYSRMLENACGRLANEIPDEKELFKD